MAPVKSLVGELRFHKMQGTTKKIKKGVFFGPKWVVEQRKETENYLKMIKLTAGKIHRLID